MGVPEQPSEDGFFNQQHGYADIEVKTHKYSDKPTPISADQNNVTGFFAEKTDREHQKKYAKEGGRKIFDILVNVLCK